MKEREKEKKRKTEGKKYREKGDKNRERGKLKEKTHVFFWEREKNPSHSLFSQRKPSPKI